MDQPLPQLGQVSHPGLAAAVTAYRSGDPAAPWTGIASQLLYGYILLNSTQSSIDFGPDGKTAMPGSTIAFQTLQDRDGRPGLAVFTSQAEIHRVLPAEQLSQATGLAQPADELGGLLAVMNLDFIVIDPGSTQVTIPREMIDEATRTRHDVGMRAALETGEAARRTVLDGLADAQGDLSLAGDPTSAGPDGRLTRLRTTTSPTGGELICVYTSSVEVALRHSDDVPIVQTYDSVLDGTLGGSYEGLILNPGSSWIVLTRPELQAAASRRAARAAASARSEAKTAAKAEKAAAKASKRAR